MNFTTSFLRVADKYPEFKEALEIVKTNADEGKIWLTGGFLSRSIIQDLYGVPMAKDIDFDFIVEKSKSEFQLPKGWRSAQNKYGNPKFIGPDFEIDYIPLNNIHSIRRRNLESTIENYLSGTPLNVQSIAFDVSQNKVIGDVGMKAISDKVVTINNPEQAAYNAGKKGVTPADLVKNIAEQFGFEER